MDIGQEAQIQRANSAVSSAQRAAGESWEKAEHAEEKVQRLALLCQAMWELLSEHANVSNNDLVRKVLEVDRRDGNEDNKMRPRVIDCPKCRNKVSTRRPKCVICGSVLATSQPFEI